jgi:hypothetical protein
MPGMEVARRIAVPFSKRAIIIILVVMACAAATVIAAR